MKAMVLKCVMVLSLMFLGYIVGVQRGTANFMRLLADDKDVRGTVRVWIEKVDRGEVQLP